MFFKTFFVLKMWDDTVILQRLSPHREKKNTKNKFCKIMFFTSVDGYNLFCFVCWFCFSYFFEIVFWDVFFLILVKKCHFCFDNKKENKKHNFLKKRKRKKRVFKTQILIQSVVKNVIQNSTDIPNFELLPRTDSVEFFSLFHSRLVSEYQWNIVVVSQKTKNFSFCWGFECSGT